MRKSVRYLILVLLVPVTLFVALIVYASVSDYRPPEREVLKQPIDTVPSISDSAVIHLLTWNIGYCGLDKNMDFFYDGGKKVRTPRKQMEQNFAAISSFLESDDTANIFLIQEIDVNSKRSYHFNEVGNLTKKMKGYQAFYTKNYDVFFVPVPFLDPMGSVNSGLLALSRFNPSMVERFSFPGQYAWPKRLFMLDRCFLVMHFPVTGGKELLVINTHNEAYDNGSIRDMQMAYFKKYLLSEYQKGNYIVAGGDWNQCPPGFKPEFRGEVFDSINNKSVEAHYLPEDWHWLFNPAMPTNRRVDVAYTKGKTMTTVIDFYLLSPNIKPISIQTADLGFDHSDHQPVSVKIALQPK